MNCPVCDKPMEKLAGHLNQHNAVPIIEGTWRCTECRLIGSTRVTVVDHDSDHYDDISKIYGKDDD